jgi:hypothetical protein
MPEKPTPRGAAWYAGYALFLGLVLGVAVLFYFGGYTHLLSNESSSLSVEIGLTQSRAHRDASVVVLGNSTAAEDFHANSFNAHSPGKLALNLGVPGGHIYLFERMLQASMREGIHPRTVILIVTPEFLSLRSDFDYLQNDLITLKTVLDYGDVFHLASHARNLHDYIEYSARIAVRPVLFRAELRDFFAHPSERLKEASVVRGWLASFGPNSPMVESDNSFSVCEAGALSQLPQTIERLRAEGRIADASNDERVLAGYKPRVHQPLKVDAFETARFRRMLERFAALRVPVYLVDAPYYDPDGDQYPLDYRRSVTAAIQQVVMGISGVALLPDFPADCSLFFDSVHLNRKGGEQFTEYLRTRVI